jgi:hypothetical protein
MKLMRLKKEAEKRLNCSSYGRIISFVITIALCCSSNNAFNGSRLLITSSTAERNAIASNFARVSPRTTKICSSRSDQEPPVLQNDESRSRNSNGAKQRWGVRSRVKKVLAKAKNRTKVLLTGSALTIADAASIGAFEKGGSSAYEERTDKPILKLMVNGSSKEPAKGDSSQSNFSAATITKETSSSSSSYIPVDAFSGDMSAAFSMPVDPLPFERPLLTDDQEELLRKGERIQYQREMGNQGYGYVVMDVQASPDIVWDCLLDFHSYPQLIPTVRDIRMYTNTHLERDYRAEKPIDYEDGTVATLKHGVPSVTRAAFTLSKFRLNIAAIHKYTPHPQGDYMVFTLDPACTNFVLQFAKGVWHTQKDPYSDQSVS